MQNKNKQNELPLVDAVLVVVVLGVAQVAPVNWEVQVQTKPSPYRKQVPPFKHGFVAQALRTERIRMKLLQNVSLQIYSLLQLMLLLLRF